jgi:hypothetical protein
MRRKVLPTTYRKVLASTVGVSLATLCHCSILYDVNAIDDRGSEAGSTDMTPGGADLDASPSGAEGTDDDGATVGDDGGDVATVGDEVGIGSPSPGSDDAGGILDALVDAGHGGANGQDASDATMVDEPGKGSETGTLDATSLDATSLDATDAGSPDGPAVGAPDTGTDAAPDGGDLTAGLVAFYPFDETTGTTSADTSGHGHLATMHGATFAAGLHGNAATMNGSAQYVVLPGGIVDGLTSFSIASWVYVTAATLHNRVFDFGTGMVAYMYLSPGTTQCEFAITATGPAGDQRIDGPSPVTGSWQHVAVTLSGAIGLQYVNGVQVAQNITMTLNATSLGTTTLNYLGHSQFATDPDLNGKIDDFRIYNRALSASEVQQLFSSKQ